MEALERFRVQTNSHKDIRQASETVWAAYISADLIHGRGLMLCLSCLGLFHDNGDADEHPRDHVVVVNRFFAEKEITSATKFVDFIVQTIADTPQVDQPDPKNTGLLPAYTRAHPSWAPKRPKLVGPRGPRGEEDNIGNLLAQLTHKEEVIYVLQAELDRVLKDNEILFRQVFNFRNDQQRRFTIIQRLSQEIVTISGGCDCECTGHEQQGPKSAK